MRRRLHLWLALLLAAPLWPGCGGSEESKTVERGEFPPVEETPPPEEALPPEAGQPGAAAKPFPEIPLTGETPPVEESAPAAPPTPTSPQGPADVPWPEGGQLVEVVPLGDPEQSNEVAKNVFEVRALPEDALADYQAVLARSGWQTEFMGTETVVAYKGSTMLLVSPVPSSGKTLLEVIVSPSPDEKGTGVQ